MVRSDCSHDYCSGTCGSAAVVAAADGTDCYCNHATMNDDGMASSRTRTCT